jgi:acyl-CoA hydrolase
MVISESRRLVRPEHLNHHGFLFGGTLLQWLDEQAYMAVASMTTEDANLVTVGIDRVEFRYPVKLGAILRFRSFLAHVGRTSLTVFVEVSYGAGIASQNVFDAYVTFVCTDQDGKPRPFADVLTATLGREDLDPVGKQKWDEIEAQREFRKIKPKTFVQLYLEGSVKEDQIDEYFEKWHKRGYGDVHSYLGLSKEDYMKWVENPSVLASILQNLKTNKSE